MLENVRQLEEMVDSVVLFVGSMSKLQRKRNNGAKLKMRTPEQIANGYIYIATELHLLADCSCGYIQVFVVRDSV